MNKQTARLLEQHFDTAFATPDGIKKLRELILTLAMQGKLVPQDPNDQPASELLKEIADEKARLIKAGKLKPQKPLPQIKPKEMPCAIPYNWQWVRLIDIAQYNGRPNAKPEDLSSETWVLDLEDIEKETSVILRRATYAERLSKSSKSLFCKGDVLYGKLRPYLNKVVVAEEDGVCTTEIVPIVSFSGIFPVFLKYLLQRPAFLSYVNSLSYGVKMPRLGSDDAIASIHPLPPVAEQKRIVARIEQLMTRCDELENLRAERDKKRLETHAAAINALLSAGASENFNAAWRFITQHFDELYSVKENVAELRKVILQLAVMGKLVPQDPNDQPASELLKEIAAEKACLIKVGKLKPQKPLPPITEIEFNRNKPYGWVVRRFGDIFSLEYGDNLPSEKRTSSGEYPVYGSNGVVGTHFEPSVIEPCIVVGRKGSAGALNLSKTEGCWVTDVAYFCIPPKVVDLEFAFKLFHTLDFESLGKGIKPGLNRNEAYLIPFFLPPINEQKRIVARIDQLMTLCDNLEQNIAAATDSRTALLNAMMSKV
ncbi:MAG: restriction endonuclease [Candidatus Riflebacteria bacterium HGW-Riflebacteria-1]|jgi:type I restriction enzyme S subunit|nr:MAG: restriction endonuclease [Candidatus Riflebacteria bacterium HGW-Riflebacteria-1]